VFLKSLFAYLVNLQPNGLIYITDYMNVAVSVLHPAHPAGQVMAETIRAARPVELARMRMDDNLTFFEDAMGSMERILRTPIPLRCGPVRGCGREGGVGGARSKAWAGHGGL